MTSEHIQTLLSPPSYEASTSRAVLFLNSNFSTIDEFTSNVQKGDSIPEQIERRNDLRNQASFIEMLLLLGTETVFNVS